MAAEPTEITRNYDSFTDRELLVEILTLLRSLATPEAIAMLDKIVNNPAMRWRRRNGE